MAATYCAGEGLSGGDGGTVPVGNLPSDPPVTMDSGYSWYWRITPAIPHAATLWRVTLDCYATNSDGESGVIIVRAGVASDIGDDGPLFGPDSPLVLGERATVTIVGTDPVPMGSTWPLLRLRPNANEDYGPFGDTFHLYSVCWEPIGALSARPRRQVGRTDGLLGAPRQHRTPVRQLSGMR